MTTIRPAKPTIQPYKPPTPPPPPKVSRIPTSTLLRDIPTKPSTPFLGGGFPSPPSPPGAGNPYPSFGNPPSPGAGNPYPSFGDPSPLGYGNTGGYGPYPPYATTGYGNQFTVPSSASLYKNEFTSSSNQYATGWTLPKK